uniref:Plastid-encoded RNA polymerase subunit alpha n=1 Tax=Chromochloris zofingiensis TaxID=31302 RepID=A0A140HA82_9CHLO|nr:alpha subunit of RNA polymerase [Chromochloris zofingiensis]AMO01081.1 alpha subunit of RNA polymerase [Chromochloris zofingiensis]
MNEFFLSCKESRIDSPRNFYGCYYLGPFNAGYSLTVANALRRTLLSELPGISITSVEIEGVTHEYCTIPGVRDSVIDILLNFKEIVLVKKSSINDSIKPFVGNAKNNNNRKGHPNNWSSNIFENTSSIKPFLGYLQVRGPGVVRAIDLKLPSFIKCVDPDQYIATLSEDGVLNLKFEICEGKNYQIQNGQVNRTENPSFLKSNNDLNRMSIEKENQKFPSFKSKGFSIPSVPSTPAIQKGFWIQPMKKNSERLYTDAVFMPVQKVNYIIESYGSQDLNANNKIVILEIWTNGSIHPRNALYLALSNLFTLFSQLEKMKLLNLTFAKILEYR